MNQGWEQLVSFVEAIVERVVVLQAFYEKEYGEQDNIAKFAMLLQVRSSSTRTLGIVVSCLPADCPQEIKERLRTTIRQAIEQINTPPLIPSTDE